MRMRYEKSDSERKRESGIERGKIEWGRERGRDKKGTEREGGETERRLSRKEGKGLKGESAQ